MLVSRLVIHRAKVGNYFTMKFFLIFSIVLLSLVPFHNIFAESVYVKPVEGSKYVVDAVLVLRDSNNSLVGVAHGQRFHYADTDLIDYYLDSVKSTGYFSLDGKDFIQWDLTQSHKMDGKIGMIATPQFIIEYQGTVYTVFAGSCNALVVEEGDTLTIYWKILREVA